MSALCQKQTSCFFSRPPVIPLRSWRHEESQVESSEHQDNANIHDQPFPESVSEEHEIYTDYNGCHRQHVKHYSYPSVHLQNALISFLAQQSSQRARRNPPRLVFCEQLGGRSPAGFILNRYKRAA